ncbi:hypothetical protein A2W67_03155 [Candidatus Nomurabacteria bacterium RIFCSPLOWO2_02_40_28]|uniref:Gluconeogenesis factor n=2 Tax=Candidatus Nomuraibacteriota TaxID=1752729 RepID=A0A837HX65_9BACT|nr:MAG: hypothetical protein UT27_C0002G0032 [Candidatus Nomurabacteria bacterium GW2011_GWD2_39_12]KKR20988.1 MAG: hypothetical protein UT51_C0001G0126 [Candidatus Nomurabacteria bacterium GW2011_GWC2_39_41]KKR36990.1 MAG: hypothetical protein UT70_C0004G0033 [Candidatus Nomurabacteria bacterium GW2011_GWE2_40_10]KKR38937.1 MAG: hypothetical protein UT73_C0001G0125 [Candidatus Nomurabacteria bacterium GW2011_GWB1_40_11]KKR40179.1 MAG: hypothetical protein UT74_C0002G0074 [Parcubacteria group b
MQSKVKNIVTIGGGTGSYRLLSGLKNITNISIFAVASMADDGGSTGILREKFGVHPMGDIRQCFSALTLNTEMYEFLKHRNTDGHMIGNWFIAGLEKLTGNFEEALEIATKFLKPKGTIIPVTLDDAQLGVLLTNGQKIEGESKISTSDLKIVDVRKIFYRNKVQLNPKAAKAIQEADYIVICPGNFYGSIVPNLIVEGFKESLLKSRGKVIAIENLKGEDTNTYLDKLEFYLGRPVDNLIKGEAPLRSKETIIPISGDIMKRSLIRHDSSKLAQAISKIINKK